TLRKAPFFESNRRPRGSTRAEVRDPRRVRRIKLIDGLRIGSKRSTKSYPSADFATACALLSRPRNARDVYKFLINWNFATPLCGASRPAPISWVGPIREHSDPIC